MYSGATINEPSGKAAAVAKPLLPTIAALFCGGIILFLLAATIVLALIPLYVSTKSATLSQSSTTSQPITLSVSLDEGSSGRRRRDDVNTTSNLTDVVGCTVGPTGQSSIRSQLFQTLSDSSSLSSLVQDLVMSSITIAYDSGCRKKRFVLSKRDCSTNTVIMIIIFYIKYVPRCDSSCQTRNSNGFSTKFKKLGTSGFSLDNIDAYKSGVLFKRIKKIRFIGILYISSIRPGHSSSTDGTRRPTRFVTAGPGSSGNETASGNGTMVQSSTTPALTG